MIIWLTGQPGSGKTTLACNIIEKIENENSNRKIINIDGDDLRHISSNQDYSKEGRIKNISTAISIAISKHENGVLDPKYPIMEEENNPS